MLSYSANMPKKNTKCCKWDLKLKYTVVRYHKACHFKTSKLFVGHQRMPCM